ncbi:MAG: YihY/virulence factor BrkB family protein [Egibacteraceae bacterium]
MSNADVAKSLKDVKLTRADWTDVAKATLAEIKRDDVPSLAAGVAFKIFLSLFPSLLAAVAIFGLVTSGAELAQLLNQLRALAPNATEFLQQPLRDLVAQNPGLASTTAIIGALGGIWAASSAAVTLMKALSRAYEVEEGRKFVGQRVIALAITLALFLALITMALLLVAGGSIEDAILERTTLIGAVETTADVLSTIARYLMAVLALMVLFAFVYWVGPDRHPRPSWRWISPGAVVGVVGWLLLSGLFGVYTSIAQPSENPAYGTFGSIIVFLLWLQLSMVALLIGAEINSEIRRARRRKTDLVEQRGFGTDHVPRAEEPAVLGALVPDQLGAVGAVSEPQRLPAAAPARDDDPPSPQALAAVVAGVIGVLGLAARLLRR